MGTALDVYGLTTGGGRVLGMTAAFYRNIGPCEALPYRRAGHTRSGLNHLTPAPQISFFPMPVLLLGLRLKS
jgi:hypothetical protein